MNNQKVNSSLPSASSLSFDAASLIKYKLSDELLARVAASGSLRANSCRSAVWRLLLRCLPYETNDWETVLSRSRHAYRVLKKNNLIDPHDDRFSQDPQLNNPLAPLEHNPWNTFFEDNELRDIIGKDVARTFPEIEFFQQEWVHQIMSDILLVYAKENPFINYKQGMHEILAPIIFVIYSDIEAYHHAKENDELKTLTLQEEDILNCLFCKEFIEHDSYNLFCAFMLEVAKWYEDSPSASELGKKTVKEPYLRVQDSVPSSRLMEDLTDVGLLLHETDPTLAKHLNTLDIPPQLYGIRWLRLLFGRELPLHDLLFLWDVLLIDRPIVPLVKCIFVSLLVQIRHLLLSTDYGGCLQYLMRYPPIADIDSFIKLARHYRNPKKNARPAIKTNNYSHITVTGKSHPNRTQRPNKQIHESPSKRNNIESPPSILTLAPVFEKVKNTIRDRASTVSVPSSPSKKDVNNRGPSTSQITQKVEIWGKEVQLMEEQVSCLQTRLNEQDMLCCQVSKALEQCAENVKIAKTDEQRDQLAIQLVELSKILMSKKTMMMSSPTSDGGAVGGGRERERIMRKGSPEERQKSRDPTPLRQSNEMVDLTAKRY